MLVVSNTSPILNLAIIGHLDLLRQQVGSVIIPPAVFGELRTEEELPGSSEIRQAIQADWLRIMSVEKSPLYQAVSRDLDHGEAEAIALAVQSNADLILLDERDGRRIARRLSLQTTGVLGILLKAHRLGSIGDLAQVLSRLEREAGFRIGESLRRSILIEAARLVKGKRGELP